MRTQPTRLSLAITIFPLLLATTVMSQNDGDHPVTNTVSGITYLATDAIVGTATPDGLTVGTTPNGAADLVVEGSQMANPSIEQFRTIGHYASSAEQETNWRLFRMQSNGTPRELGRLWAATSTPGGTTNFNFNVQAQADGGSLWLRNPNSNGIKIPDDAASTPTFTYNSQTNTGQRYAYVGIGQAGTIGSAPWTRLHLTHRYSPSGAAIEQFFRGTMQNGVMMSGDNDAMYVGQQHVLDGTQTTDEATNALFSWGEQNLPTGDHDYDNATFRFFATPGASNVGSAGTTAGLEFIRLYPYRINSSSAIQNYVGIGDWASGSDRPSERLDLLDRTIRLRNFTDNTYLNNSYDRVLVVNPSDGRVHWREASTLTGSTDCDWDPVDATNLDISTAWAASGTNGSCPDSRWLVGIGNDAPENKLEVIHSEEDRSITGGMLVQLDADEEGFAYGIRSIVQPYDVAPDYGIGIFSRYLNPAYSGWASFSRLEVSDGGISANDVRGASGMVDMTAGSASRAFGLHGESQIVDATVGSSIGVYGWSHAASAQVTDSYGVYGQAADGTNNYSVYATSPGSGSTDWSIYAAGRTFTPGGNWTSSDAGLKQNITEVDVVESAAVLDDIALHHFEFNPAACPQLTFPSGQQLGVIAQELEGILPNLVTDVHQPAQVNAAGEELQPAIDFKAINQEALVPYLIAGHQAQQSIIAQLQAEMAAMQEQLAECCAGGMIPQGGNSSRSSAEEVTGDARALRIAPNPFTDRTTLYCNLERGGRMQLIANSADGRELIMLSEGQREAGEFQQVWSTEQLAPGVYYVTLLLDGEPLVKRAVKVGR